MTAKEILEIVKESNLWPPLTGKEKQEVIVVGKRQLHPIVNLLCHVCYVYLDYNLL